MIKLSRSEKPDKKFKVVVGLKKKARSEATPLKTIHFGAKGMSDYTINRDPERKRLYLKRHDPRGRVRARENWSKSGIQTAGFWSRWLLWNKPSLDESIRDIEKRFRVKIMP
jgi:hypothetical protein